MQDQPRSYKLPQQARLKRNEDFQRVLAARRSAADSLLIVYALPNNLQWSRLGLAVGKKLGSAVVRSRLKRLLREAYRLQQHEIPAGFDFVVMPRRGVAFTLQALEHSLPRVCRRATHARVRPKPLRRPPSSKGRRS